MKTQPNAQTPGPLAATNYTDNGGNEWTVNPQRRDGQAGRILAVLNGADSDRNALDARLLALAYTAFDKSGRELGVDAAILAERIDLAALIKACHLLVMSNDRNPSYFAHLQDSKSTIAGILMPLAGELRL
jgi:hypothetical protein